MTGRFDTLIYTDCRPGEGLQGSAGFQFQACSRGAPRAAMAPIQRHLLYEAPDNWMRERRPPSDYPPSLSHTAGEFFATAAGVYIGREATGHREGNHLTHSIVTRDRHAYGLVRPAQLFQAPFWTARPAPTTECPPLEAGWQPGGLDAVRIQQYVRSQPRGAELLRALVSALQAIGGPDGRRVLFIARGTRDVMRWLVAATLLLPQEIAVGIGFKVFTTDPALAAQPVVAVHPDWRSTTATVDNDLGYVVVDLVEGRCSEVRDTPHAAFWVPLFFAEDAFGVLDAIEFAHACKVPDPATARVVARAAVLRQVPVGADATAAVNWLRVGPQPLVQAYGPGLAELILGSENLQDPALLRALEAATQARGLLREARRAHKANFEADLDAVLRGEPLPPTTAGAGAGADADRDRERVEAALATAAPAQFDGLLRLAARNRLPVSLTRVGEKAREFILGWVENPGWDFHINEWACAAELEELLREELGHRMAAGLVTSDEVALTWGHRLTFRLDLATRLDHELAAMAMRGAKPGERRAILDACLKARPDQSPQSRAWVGAVLFRRTEPLPSEVRSLLAGVPDGTAIDQGMFQSVLRRLELDEPIPADYLAMCQEMVRRKLLVPNETLRDGLLYGAQLAELLPRLAERGVMARDQIDALRSIPPHWVGPYLRRIEEIIVNGPAHPGTAMPILEAFPDLKKPVAARLCMVLMDGDLNGRPAHPANAVLAHLLAYHEDIGPYQNRLDRSLREWAARVPRSDIRAAGRLARELSEPTQRDWNRMLMTVTKSGPGGIVPRLFGWRRR